jgi:hypothetical protein
VVVERQGDLRAIRQVGGDVVRRQLDLAVLNVLGVDEQNVLEDAELLQQRSADETVEIAAGDQAMRAGDGHD